MNAKRKVLSDHELIDRLIHMRLLTDKQTVNQEIMPVFADIFFGLFVWDSEYATTQAKLPISEIYELFQELEERSDYENMYLLLSMQYDRIGKTLPDPIWWLMCSEQAVDGFMHSFMERFKAHMTIAATAEKEAAM